MAFQDSGNPNVISLVAPSGGVVSGSMLLIGTIVCLPLATVDAGYLFDAVAAGPIGAAPAAAEVWSPGDSLYWDDINKVMTKTSTSNTQCGYVRTAKAASEPTGNMCLTAIEGTQGTGSTSDIADGAVTLAKMANLAQDKFIIRTTTSTGAPQTATCTAAGRALIDDVDAAAQRTTLGLGTAATHDTGDYDAAGAAAAAASASLPLHSTADDSAKVGGTTPSAYGKSLIDDADAATARTTLGLAGTVRSGAGDPDNGVGVDGDIYIKTNGAFYARASGTYGLLFTSVVV